MRHITGVCLYGSKNTCGKNVCICGRQQVCMQERQRVGEGGEFNQDSNKSRMDWLRGFLWESLVSFKILWIRTSPSHTPLSFIFLFPPSHHFLQNLHLRSSKEEVRPYNYHSTSVPTTPITETFKQTTLLYLYGHTLVAHIFCYSAQPLWPLPSR